ncbi:MAG: DUF948 domain-containing protein [Syntrophales bacterium LBB04]|nr:DUF948 domain-containing protein [Syntrophales bacterium LBB04]
MMETGFVIISAALLILFLCLIPLFWQMWRAAKDMAKVLEGLDKNLPGILKNLEEITANINAASNIVRYEAACLSLLGDKVRNFLQTGKILEDSLRQGVALPLWDAYKMGRGLLRGVRVFFEVLTDKEARGKR